jgi:MSHA biogenesis protein MshM
MYLDYFGLKKQPFGITPDTSLFYAGAERGDVLDAVLYALNSGEGIIKVVGEVGSGKTMLSRMLTNSTDSNTEFVFLLNPRVKAEQALFAIAYDLGLVVDAGDKSIQILHVLQGKLLELYQAGKKVVLIIDEAQQMPLSTLEEIRLLSNLETETEKLLQIILFGQPELDEHLDTPQIRQLRERITYSFYLTALDWKKADLYLHFRLEKAGHQGRTIFKSSAIKLLAKCSDGTLRRMNVLADKALLAAFLDKSPVVEAKHVRLATKDNQKSNTKPHAAIYVGISLLLFSVLAGVAYWYMEKTEPTVHAEVIDDTKAEPSAVNELAAAILVHDSKPVTGQTILEQRVIAYDTWRAESKETYTLQIFSIKSNTKDSLLNEYLDRIKQHVDIDQVFIRKSGYKQLDYIVYYQAFSNVSNATRALKQLPKIIKKSQPYVTAIPK